VRLAQPDQIESGDGPQQAFERQLADGLRVTPSSCGRSALSVRKVHLAGFLGIHALAHRTRPSRRHTPSGREEIDDRGHESVVHAPGGLPLLEDCTSTPSPAWGEG
jgi:hypothetical protein